MDLMLVFQVWFSWSDKPIFRRGMAPGIGQIYDSILALLETDHPVIKRWVKRLLSFWDE